VCKRKVFLLSHNSSCNIFFFLFLLFLQHRAEIQRSSKAMGSMVSQRYLPNPVGAEPRLCFCSKTHRLAASGQEKFSQGKSTCRDLREAGQRVDRVVVVHSHRVDKICSRRALNDFCLFVCATAYTKPPVNEAVNVWTTTSWNCCADCSLYQAGLSLHASDILQ